MKNKRRKNKMKLPRHMTLVWIQGWINGRTGTAGLSDGMLKSGFLLHLSNRYAAYTAGEITALDTTVHRLAAKAEKLFLELKAEARQDTGNNKPEQEAHNWKGAENGKPGQETHGEQDTGIQKSGQIERATLAEVQAERAASLKLAAERRAWEEKKKKNMRTLVEIGHQIREAEEGYYTRILETAKNLEAVFTTYAKGVLWRKPLSASLIPPVNAETRAVEMYRKWKISEHILEKIKEVTADEKDETSLAKGQMGNKTGSKTG